MVADSMHIFFYLVEAILIGAHYALPNTNWGDLVGQTLFAIGIAGLLVYLPVQAWKNRQIIRIKMTPIEPWHIIAVGLAIAIAGVAWQVYRGPVVILSTAGPGRNDAPPIPNESFVVPSPPTAAPTAPAVSQQKPKSHYSKAEIELMQESLRHLRALFEVKASAPNKTVYDLVAVTMLHGPIGTMPRPSEAAKVVDNLEQCVMQLDKDEQEIKRILREAEVNLIGPEIIPTVVDDKQAVQVFRKEIYGIIPVLRELSKIKDQINSSAFGMTEREKLSHAYSAYYQWVQDSINRIKSKANELREL
jgi:hypothetical protein